MTATVMPITKAVYVCDDVLEDRTNRKIHLLGLFNAIQPQGEAPYPYCMSRLCVFAQLVGGLGNVPAHVEVVNAATEEVVYAFPKQNLQFSTRQVTLSTNFRIHNCSFPQPGIYVVELYCWDTFIDDRILHLLPEEGS